MTHQSNILQQKETSCLRKSFKTKKKKKKSTKNLNEKKKLKNEEWSDNQLWFKDINVFSSGKTTSSQNQEQTAVTGNWKRLHH